MMLPCHAAAAMMMCFIPAHAFAYFIFRCYFRCHAADVYADIFFFFLLLIVISDDYFLRYGLF